MADTIQMSALALALTAEMTVQEAEATVCLIPDRMQSYYVCTYTA